jgi:hypothetical protein
MYQENFSDDDEFEDDLNWEDETPPMGQPPRKRWWNWKHWLFIILIIMLVIGVAVSVALQQLQSASNVMPTYLSFDHQLAATVRIASTKKINFWDVHVTFLDKNHQSTDTIHCYINQGDTLTFQGDVLHFAPWLNSFNLHSGYKLNGLRGCFFDANNMNNDVPYMPNGGEDNFFIQLEGHPWAFSTASADHSKPFNLRPAQLKSNQQNETYNLYTSPYGLTAMLVA